MANAFFSLIEKDLTGGSTPIGPAGGDLSGTYPNPTVAKIQGRNVDSAAPATGDVIYWDGTKWTNISFTSNVITGQTLWVSPVIGEVGYISGNNTWTKANASSISTSDVKGIYQGKANTLSLNGPYMFFDSGLTLTAGNKVYLSDVTSGRVTNIKPTATGHVEQELGTLLDASGYDSVNGSAQLCVWGLKTPIIK